MGGRTETQTLVVGGGLSGLAVASALEAEGQDYVLVEARDRIGGRILTEVWNGGHFDLGPAWVWPGQPRIARLIDHLGLDVFEQFADGDLVFEDETGRVQRGRGLSSMAGSLRVRGGLAMITHALANGLPSDRKRRAAQVVGLEKTGAGVTALLANDDRILAKRVVLALPPRLAAGIKFTPHMTEEMQEVMTGIPTWMAGQAKVVAVYADPFWREMGLSGDAMSRIGPLVEIHDASPVAGGPFALFGFVGIPANLRGNEIQLRNQVKAQLTRLFGEMAATPAHLFVTDWARDRFTATPDDAAPLLSHPSYGLPRHLADFWGGSIVFAGSEVAPQFGGYVEGALEAAENACCQIGVAPVPFSAHGA